MKTTLFILAAISASVFCSGQSKKSGTDNQTHKAIKTANDLTLTKAYATYGSDGYYSQVPRQQMQSMRFGGQWYNAGSNPATNIIFGVNVQSNGSVIWEQQLTTASLNSNGSDFDLITIPFLPVPANGSYMAVSRIMSDASDDNPNDNSDTLHFAITDSVYARDEEYTTSIGPEMYNGHDGDFIGVTYRLIRDQEVNSISVFIAPDCDLGTQIIGKIYTCFPEDSIWYEMVCSDIYDIQNSDLGHWITMYILPDGTSEFLQGEKLYLAGIECFFSGANPQNLLIGADSSGHNNYMGAAMYSGDSGSFYLPVIPMIRLNVNVYSCNNLVSGRVFYDENENGIRDSGEADMNSQTVILHAPTGENLYATTDQGGIFRFQPSFGNYIMTALAPQYWHFTTNSIFNVDLTFSDSISSFEFGLHPAISISDGAVYLDGWVNMCGEQLNYTINYKNFGTVAQDGTVELKYDSLLSFVSSYPSPDNIWNNTLTWNYTDLVNAYTSPIQGYVYIYFLPPDVSLYLGDTMISTVKIEPVTGDICASNNYDTLVRIVTCAYDPNSKSVTPAGVGSNGYIPFGQNLSYTIHFQNTGNDTAHTVVIKDTLDQDLKIESFHLLASNHPVVYTIEDFGIATFTFQNIMLPDSGADQTGSNGFVKYFIEPKDLLPENSIVNNIAYIFFDYNPPVATNTVRNTYVSVVPEPLSAECLTPNRINNTLVYPNPFHSETTILFPNKNHEVFTLHVFDLTGRNVKTIGKIKTDRVDFPVKDLCHGIYYFQLAGSTGSSYSGKMVIE